jgi:hypothetical protein
LAPLNIQSQLFETEILHNVCFFPLSNFSIIQLNLEMLLSSPPKTILCTCYIEHMYICRWSYRNKSTDDTSTPNTSTDDISTSNISTIYRTTIYQPTLYRPMYWPNFITSTPNTSTPNTSTVLERRPLNFCAENWWLLRNLPRFGDFFAAIITWSRLTSGLFLGLKLGLKLGLG